MRKKVISFVDLNDVADKNGNYSHMTRISSRGFSFEAIRSVSHVSMLNAGLIR